MTSPGFGADFAKINAPRAAKETKDEREKPRPTERCPAGANCLERLVQVRDMGADGIRIPQKREKNKRSARRCEQG
ncbi:MAG: hypothetical protein LBT59_26565, partial [Clostridiales bacterium]|nr:hypothetical protein [Clostridiales bacterium]